MTVLHVPFCYAPDPMGGTEVYVSALARELRAHGVLSIIAAPGVCASSDVVDDVPVHRFVPSTVVSADDLVGDGDSDAAAAFGAILDRVQPDVVHLHARTRAVSLRTLREARRRGLPVVYTYHTPTGSCPRGTLMRWGRVPCDGRLTVGRCAACVLHAGGLPRTVALALAHTPGLGRLPVRGRLRTALGTRRRVAAAHRATREFLSEASHVVAVCSWVERLIARIGVSNAQLTLSRQGLPYHTPSRPIRATSARIGPLRLAFFGRLDPAKGLGTVLRALAERPDLDIRLDVFGIRQGGVLQESASDPRVAYHPPVHAVDVVPTLRDYDALVVPSHGFETGPLVVLEAFAAGVPVIGSRLGGIAELVTDGQDGLLVAPDDPAAWGAVLAQLAADRTGIDCLHAGVNPPRQMSAVATDMAALYASLNTYASS